MPSQARGVWVRRARAALAGVAALLGAAVAHAEEPPPVPNWWLRVGLSVGGPVRSDQERLLEVMGYGGPRLHVSFGVARKLTDYLGVGGVALLGWRSAGADDEGSDTERVAGSAPDYEETLFAFGAQVPLSFELDRKRKGVFFVTPWGGVGTGKAEFDDGGTWQTGPAFGVGTGVFFPSAYLGFSLGGYFVPLEPPGDAGGHNDLGMIYFSLILGMDVG